MDLLGPSLAELFYFCGNRFSLKTTLMIGLQLLDRFEYFHSKSMMHRDVKPENILMGLDVNSHVLHLVDMGLVKRFEDPETK